MNDNGLNPWHRDDRRGDNVVSLADRMRKSEPPRKPSRPPLINLPPVTKIMVLTMVGVHVVLSIVDPLLRSSLLDHFGFTPAVFTGAAPFTPSALITPLTYMLLHGGWTHLIMNVLMMMALGAGIERWLGGQRMAVFFILCGLGGAFAHLVLNPASTDPMIGASGGISGLFAAILVMTNRMQRQAGNTAARMLPFALVWIAITVGTGMMGMGGGGATIAWAAHVGGFLTGFIALRLMRVA